MLYAKRAEELVGLVFGEKIKKMDNEEAKKELAVVGANVERAKHLDAMGRAGLIGLVPGVLTMEELEAGIRAELGFGRN